MNNRICRALRRLSLHCTNLKKRRHWYQAAKRDWNLTPRPLRAKAFLALSLGVEIAKEKQERMEAAAANEALSGVLSGIALPVPPLKAEPAKVE